MYPIFCYDRLFFSWKTEKKRQEKLISQLFFNNSTKDGARQGWEKAEAKFFLQLSQSFKYSECPRGFMKLMRRSASRTPEFSFV